MLNFDVDVKILLSTSKDWCRRHQCENGLTLTIVSTGVQNGSTTMKLELSRLARSAGLFEVRIS